MHRSERIILFFLNTFFIAPVLPQDYSLPVQNSNFFSICLTGDLVDIQQVNPRILVQLVYSTTNNFLEEDVYGDLEKCFLRKEVAEWLSSVQTYLDSLKKGYRLLVYDGLRPRSVQYDMWGRVRGTEKQEYVADPEEGSIHNYGAAVDVTLVGPSGLPLDMGTEFDFFGDLAQPQYEERFLADCRLGSEQVKNRIFLRTAMTHAGFQPIVNEWWHFNAFPSDEVKKRYSIVEYLLSTTDMESVLNQVEDLPRDKNGFCLLVRGGSNKIYLIEDDKIRFVFNVAVGRNGLEKMKEGDQKTPLGDYSVKWMVSRSGPPKENPGGIPSYVKDGETYAVLNTELYFGNLADIRVKVLSNGTKQVSTDSNDRPISPEEIRTAQDEKLWTDAYGGKQIYVMALDYPNERDRREGRTGSCIEIHASATLEKAGYQGYPGTQGCISMYPGCAKRIYECVNPGTSVRICK